MTLVENWKEVFRRAWSVRLMALAFLLSFAEVALPLAEGVLPIGPGWFAALSGLATAGAFVTRFVAQRGLSLPLEEEADV